MRRYRADRLGGKVTAARPCDYRGMSCGCVRDGEIWLVNANIPEYLQAGRDNHPPKRPRKLRHKRQIDKLAGAVEREGMTIIPLRLVFQRTRPAKLELAVARGKKLHDKRETDRKRSWDRERGRGVDALSRDEESGRGAVKWCLGCCPNTLRRTPFEDLPSPCPSSPCSTRT